MFTGLIQTTGTVLSLKPARAAMRLLVAAPDLAGRWQVGDSIAVNGVCLTAVDMEEQEDPHPGRFAAELAEETIQRTTLSGLQPGSLLNLELPTRAGAPLGGHVVQGHVDATGTLIALVPLYPDLDHTDWRMTVELPPSLAAYVIPQGSITVDGMSLTVAAVDGNRVDIAVIPHTYRSTNLHSLLSGARVNIETDVLGKYAARRASFGLEEATQTLNSIWTTSPAARAVAAHTPLPGDPASSARTPIAIEPSASSGRVPVAQTMAPAPAPSHQPEWLTAEYLLANGY